MYIFVLSYERKCFFFIYVTENMSCLEKDKKKSSISYEEKQYLMKITTCRAFCLHFFPSGICIYFSVEVDGQITAPL